MNISASWWKPGKPPEAVRLFEYCGQDVVPHVPWKGLNVAIQSTDPLSAMVPREPALSVAVIARRSEPLEIVTTGSPLMLVLPSLHVATPASSLQSSIPPSFYVAPPTEHLQSSIPL